MDEDAHRSAAADPGPDAQSPPAASSGVLDTAEEALCPKGIRQPEAKACAVRATGGTRHTNAGGQVTTCTTDGPRAVLQEEQSERAAGDAHPPQPAAAEGRVHPGAATSAAQNGMYDGPPPGAPETEDILSSIFNEVAPSADLGLQTDKHFHNDESSAAFMASCRDGPPTTRPATTSMLQHVAQNREPKSPARDRASTSHQAHLRCTYAALGPAAAAHTTNAGDGHAGRQSVEVTSQRPQRTGRTDP